MNDEHLGKEKEKVKVGDSLNPNDHDLEEQNFKSLDSNHQSKEHSKEYYTRTIGEGAQRNNIAAAKLIAQILKSTLGPKGMDKMIIDEYGNTIITNDGATILSEMVLAHPVARMIAESSKNQEREVGDGTTTIAILTAELLSNAEKLLDQKIHPTLIIDGYKTALDLTLAAIDRLSFTISLTRPNLSKVAKTAMTGKGAEKSKELLSSLCVDSVLAIEKEEDLGKHLIKIISIPGGNIEDSTLFKGVVIENDIISSSSPNNIKNPKVVLLNSPVEIKESEIDANIQITSPTQIKEFIDAQDSILKEMAEKLSRKGVNLVFCQRGIDDLAAHYLSEFGIVAIRRVTHSDMIRLSKSTKARIVSSIDELKDSDVGNAQSLQKKTIYGESYIFLEGSSKDSNTIIIRGANTQISDEIMRALDDAIGDLITLMKDKRVVLGAGSFELYLYYTLKEEAKSYPLNERMFIDAFADAILSVPKTLTENAGISFDYLKKQLDEFWGAFEIKDKILSIQKSTGAEAFKEFYGIGVYSGELIKPLDLGIIEPFMVKFRAILSASELAIAILRIDDVIVAKPKDNNPSDY